MPRVLTLYQAEWCPFSSAVRELLTERGIDFVARQVEPWPQQREALRTATGHDQIPVLVTEDGDVHQGTRRIFAYLSTRESWPHARPHRQRFRDHHPARESDAAGQLIERAELPREDAPAEAPVRVVHDPDGSRYVISVGDRRIGLAAYRMRDGEVVITHTEIDPACEGRGHGTRLVEELLADVRRRGLHVRPLCPFVAAHIDRHPEVQDLVAPGYGQARAKA
jgi:predicted GNAT family acetyltransferase/glutaredoxin